ncbi:DHHW family protein [Desulfosporosinus acidiphilus]|uniref:DHHW family protein n=1 Tax=Desulfosporosinus acidiphilus TaxID=885581 RepID=UPI00030E240A|nr:DHHW family protein [Desulfosporosinus acidiphilus]
MKKYSLSYKYLLGILMGTYILVLVFLNMITPIKRFSETENRDLEQRPAFSFDNLFHGRFTKEYEKYIEDQFFIRDMWIGIKTDCERILLKNESNGVFLSKNNYLIQSFLMPSDQNFKAKIDTINQIAAQAPLANKYLMMVPTTAEILKDDLPAYAPNDSESAAIKKTKELLDKSITFVDVSNTLTTKKNEYIFYRNDHHWTSKGAYYAYNELSKYMGFKAHDESYYNIKDVTDDFLGSLSSKSGYQFLKPDSIDLYIPKHEKSYSVDYLDLNKVTDSIYDMKSLQTKDKYNVFFGGNFGLIKITTHVPGGKKLLVVKDSYANSLIPFLMDHYSEIYVVDPRYYEDDLSKLVRTNNINDLLILYNVNTFYNDASY